MGNRHVSAQARGSDGSELALQSTQTDAPIIPIDSIERLHNIRPDKVDWVFEQAAAEANARRKEQARVNTFVFFERILGMVFALMIGMSGIIGGIYAALQGHEWLGGIVASVTIGTLALAFLKKKPEE